LVPPWPVTGRSPQGPPKLPVTVAARARARRACDSDVPVPRVQVLFSEYREPPEYPPERNNRRQSRIPGIPVRSLIFSESAPIPAGIPDPCVPVASESQISFVRAPIIRFWAPAGILCKLLTENDGSQVRVFHVRRHRRGATTASSLIVAATSMRRAKSPTAPCASAWPRTTTGARSSPSVCFRSVAPLSGGVV
jgi:hypothetical protein